MTSPSVARTRAELDAVLRTLRGSGGRVAFVPTMGALHAGHAALIDEARGRCGPADAVVVSIFVNPMQFGPGEDLDRYPRTFDADLALCAEHGAAVVFAPSVEEVYPHGEAQVSVQPGPLGALLEGAARPTHFAGVLTVVAKLFGLVRPDLAIFGQKDYQQLTLLRRMATELCMGVEVIGAETVREADGLALSSRNRFLSEAERAQALGLSAALRAGAEAGRLGPDAVRRAAAAVLAEAGLAVDYLALTDPELGPTPDAGEARLLVAARVGSTRLIDNVSVSLSPTPSPTSSPTSSPTNTAVSTKGSLRCFAP